MVELKVRAKNLGEWVEGYFCVYRGIPQILVDESSWEPIDDIKTVGRYTGLCDKNGNKIFEGDIITAHFQSNHSKQKFSVIFENGTFLFDNGCVKVPVNDIYCLKVIGNIHNNPELLKGGVE